MANKPTKSNYETKIKKQLDEEQKMLSILNDIDNRRRFISRLKNDLEYAEGFKFELNKRGFFSVRLSNFFYNINNYIESLVYTCLWEVKQQDLIKIGKKAYDFRDVKPKKLADLFWNYKF